MCVCSLSQVSVAVFAGEANHSLTLVTLSQLVTQPFKLVANLMVIHSPLNCYVACELVHMHVHTYIHIICAYVHMFICSHG